jgi:Family of unknown function (DUF5681)
MTNAANSAGKQRGRPFRKGRSGNPSGKPRGARHRTTMAVQALLEGEAEALTRKCIELAKAGDTTALRLCMERIAPAPKSRAVQLPMLSVETADDVLTAQAATIRAMAVGEITPDEAATIAGVLDAKRKAIETVQLEGRVAKLEQQSGGSNEWP